MPAARAGIPVRAATVCRSLVALLPLPCLTRQSIESARLFLTWMRGSSTRMTTVNRANHDTRPSQTRAAELRQARADRRPGGGHVLRPSVRGRAACQSDVSRRFNRAAPEVDGDAFRRGERTQ